MHLPGGKCLEERRARSFKPITPTEKSYIRNAYKIVGKIVTL